MRFLSTIFLIIFCYFANAQFRPQHHKFLIEDEKIKVERIAYFSEKIKFSVKEAQDFWPIYNECEATIQKLIEEEHGLLRELKNNLEELSDKEVENKLNRIIQLRIDKGEIEKRYHKQYESILSPKKIALFYNADRDFRKNLIHKYKPRGEKPRYNKPRTPEEDFFEN